jgi:glycerate kinase
MTSRDRLPLTPLHVLVAPQELKGSLTAPQAAASLAAGVRSADPTAAVDIAPLSDGGPGFAATLAAAGGGRLVRVPARDPFGRWGEAELALLDGGETAVIEMAATAGLWRLRPGEADPRRTTTLGVGDLIRAALDQGARRLLVGLGGSATNDGGAGMAQALGVRLLDAAGAELPPGGAALARLVRVDRASLDARLAGVTVTGATDVRNVLCGPAGASAVYGPQKGADAAAVRELDAALAHYAAVLAATGRAVADLPGAGAAGGLGAGLAAFLGATLEPGFALVAAAVRLPERVAAADLVLTGEGRLDGQSLYGKTTAGVAALGAAAGRPVVALCGALGEGWQPLLEAGLTAALSIAPAPLPRRAARRHAAAFLAATAEQAVRLFLAARRQAG